MAHIPLVYAFAILRIYTLAAKKALAAPLAKAMGFRYEPEGGLPREEVLASGLFPTPDRYEAEDLVTGEVRGFPFAASDVRLYREVRTRDGSHYQKLFEGTLYRFTLPFAVEGEVRLGPQGRGRVAGGGPRREYSSSSFSTTASWPSSSSPSSWSPWEARGEMRPCGAPTPCSPRFCPRAPLDILGLHQGREEALPGRPGGPRSPERLL